MYQWSFCISDFNSLSFLTSKNKISKWLLWPLTALSLSPCCTGHLLLWLPALDLPRHHCHCRPPPLTPLPTPLPPLFSAQRPLLPVWPSCHQKLFFGRLWGGLFCPSPPKSSCKHSYWRNRLSDAWSSRLSRPPLCPCLPAVKTLLAVMPLGSQCTSPDLALSYRFPHSFIAVYTTKSILLLLKSKREFDKSCMNSFEMEQKIKDANWKGFVMISRIF